MDAPSALRLLAFGLLISAIAGFSGWSWWLGPAVGVAGFVANLAVGFYYQPRMWRTVLCALIYNVALIGGITFAVYAMAALLRRQISN